MLDMKALIVEDDRENAAFVSRGLQSMGFLCETAHDGEHGHHLLASDNFDIAVIDIQLPGISGLELIRRLRESGNRIPVIILSALNQAGDKICGLNIGADDYLSKPFALNELKARVNALLRRATGTPAGERIIVRDLLVDTTERKAYRAGHLLELTQREYGILEYLARNAQRTITIRMILQEVWKYNATPLSKVVETRLCLLRKKLNQHGTGDIIHTVRGFGYVLR